LGISGISGSRLGGDPWPLEGRCLSCTVGLVVRHYKTHIKRIPPGCAVPPSRAFVPEGWKPYGTVSRSPGKDGVAAYGPLVP